MARLDEMADSVNITRGVSAVVLENFQKISLARKRLWTWAQITAAVSDAYPDLRISEAAVQSAFKRIERGVQSKRIKPPSSLLGKAQSAASGQTKPAATETATPVVRKPLPGIRKIGEGTDDERFARLRALGIDTSSMEKE